MINHQQINPQCYNQIDSESFQKIFPRQYIQKFAKHLKVLQFEKTLFSNPPPTNNGQVKFTKRNNSTQPKINPAFNSQQHRHKQSAENFTSTKKSSESHNDQFTPIKRLNKFAKLQDTIENDQTHIKRYRQINNFLNKRLQLIPLSNSSNNNDGSSQIAPIDQKSLEYKNMILTERKRHSNTIKVIKDTGNEIDGKLIKQLMAESNREDQENIAKREEQLKNQQQYCKFVKHVQKPKGPNVFERCYSEKNLRSIHNDQGMPVTERKRTNNKSHKVNDNLLKPNNRQQKSKVFKREEIRASQSMSRNFSVSSFSSSRVLKSAQNKKGTITIKKAENPFSKDLIAQTEKIRRNMKLITLLKQSEATASILKAKKTISRLGSQIDAI